MKGKLLLISLFCCVFLFSCVPEKMTPVRGRVKGHATTNKSSDSESSSKYSEESSHNNNAVATDKSASDNQAMMSELRRRCLERQVTDYDGNRYHTVFVGNQCWLKENLRATHGRDGKIVNCYIPNGNSANVQTYGYLYEWRSAKSVCPKGWHLPTMEDWEKLEDQVVLLGMSCGDGLQKQVAKAVASEKGWQSSTNTCSVGQNQQTNNASGFSVLPAGLYNYEHYNNFGYKANFWSAKEYDAAYAYSCGVSYDNASVKKFLDTKASGFSVRCVQD